MEDRVDILRHCGVLKDLGEEGFEILAGVVRERLYANAQRLQVQGEPPRDAGVLFIGSGHIRCEVVDSDGKVFTLGTLGSGDHVGGLRLFADSLAPVTLAAEGDVTALILDRQAFTALRRQKPQVAMSLLFSLAQDFGTRLSESGSLFADFAQFAARQVELAERGTFGSYTDFGFDPNSIGQRTEPPRK